VAAENEQKYGRSAIKILVAIKQVPEREAQIHVASDGKWIDAI
jgi:hypothetical protein